MINETLIENTHAMHIVNDEQNDIETFLNKTIKMPNENKIKLFVKDLITNVGANNMDITMTDIDKCVAKLRQKYKILPSKTQMRYIYETYYMTDETIGNINHVMSRYMIKKAMRSRSGVLVSTVVLKPDKFSCPKKCSYCPTETDLSGNPTQPKSYLSTEPAMLRAIAHNFDVKGQIHDRIKTYIRTGNITEQKNNVNACSTINANSYKLEIILSGGTWESYSYDYRNQVMNEIYWAANSFDNARQMLSVEEEIEINENAKYRIIGLTIETRPDYITKTSIRDYRRWGVTRVQIGVQHYNDEILKKINRECYTKDTIKAIAMLKQCGFKVVCHLMPDLPGSSPDLDMWMFQHAIYNPHLQFDDVKIYPTAICQSSSKDLIVKSDIEDWYKNGDYIPYAETNINKLIEVLKYYKSNVQPWIRIQRLIRDIPSQSIAAGYEKKSNLRQIIQDEMKKEHKKCNCIRCMEIGDDNMHRVNNGQTRLVVRKYDASGGIEYFISIETHKQTNILSSDWIEYFKFIVTYWFTYLFTLNKLYWKGNLNTYDGLIGFCRLRIDPNPGGDIIKELKNCALIREVHVYGHSLGVGGISNVKSSQHKGFGQLLVKTAEEISTQHGYTKTAVISGVGTREYYKKKCGYKVDGTYMIKDYSDVIELYRQTIYNSINFIVFIIMIYLL